MKLVYTATQVEVKLGDEVTLHNAEGSYVITHIQAPHKPSSTGRVYVRPAHRAAGGMGYFPSVIGAEWIERGDQ